MPYNSSDAHRPDPRPRRRRPRANDYVTSLLGAGFGREEIEVLGPGRKSVRSARRARPRRRLRRRARALRRDDAARTRASRSIAERDELDFALLEEARRDGVPVLAICRGLQVVNVAIGGTLVQDVPTQNGLSARRTTCPKAAKTRLRARGLRGGGHAALGRLRRIRAAREQPPPPGHRPAGAGLVVSAVSPDGVVEAAETNQGPWLVGVQWHPENLAADGEAASRRLFDEFARAVRERAAASRNRGGGSGAVRPIPVESDRLRIRGKNVERSSRR